MTWTWNWTGTDSPRQCPFLETGSNTSTVTLRVVGGDEKGSVKSETVKYGREFQGTPTRERLRTCLISICDLFTDSTSYISSVI
jgi:hypothetical protein